MYGHSGRGGCLHCLWEWWQCRSQEGFSEALKTGAGLFSKVLAIAVTGFLTWLLVAVEILPFTAAVCVGVSVAVGILCAVLFHVQLKQGIECYPSGKIRLIFREELLFLGIFLLWTYLAGFPAAGIRNRKIYGLWLHGGHDAKQNSSCT